MPKYVTMSGKQARRGYERMNYCRNCGEILDPELRRCPYCGKRNRPDTQKHKNAGYTRSKPQAQTKLQPNPGSALGIIVRSAILVVLLTVLIVVGWVITNKETIDLWLSYEDNMEQMETYLEAEDYLMLGECFMLWNRTYTGLDTYESYYPVLHSAFSYRLIYNDVMNYVLAEEEYKDDRLDSLVRVITTDYKTFNADEYRYHENSETLENRQHVANMKEMINNMLIVYCGLTEEDTAQLDDRLSEQELYRMFDSR